MELNQNIVLALLLTLGAGLATALGALIPLFLRNRWPRLLPFSLGLSAGVMIYISFMELLAHSQEILTGIYGHSRGGLYATVALFAGIAVAALIDALVPSHENPHEVRDAGELEALAQAKVQSRSGKSRFELRRLGLFTALSIALHNFPEGIATFITSVQSPQLGLAIAVAVAIHNIPEGIAVAVPIYYSTKSRGKALWYTLLSGLAEPLGGVMAFLVLAPLMSEELIATVLAGVAGIMIYISIDELLPASRAYGHAHTSIFGFLVGMAVMALSLIII